MVTHPTLSIIIPTLWSLEESLTHREGFLEDLERNNLLGQVEVYFGFHGKPQALEMLPEGCQACFTDEQGFTQNFQNLVNFAKGKYLLLLAQDDDIDIENLKVLLGELDRALKGQPQRNIFNPLVVCEIKGYPRIQGLNLSKLFMRLGSSPGICFPCDQDLDRLLVEFKSLFPSGIYPQVWLGLRIMARAGAMQSLAKVSVAKGGEAWQRLGDAFNRPRDYGVIERLNQLMTWKKSAFGAKPSLEVFRAKLSLLIWASTIASSLTKSGHVQLSRAMVAEVASNMNPLWSAGFRALSLIAQPPLIR